MIDAGAVFELARPIANMGMVVVSTFIYCYAGEQLTTEYASIDIWIYQMSWYLIEIEMRKKVPTMLLVAQREVRLKGFAGINCSLVFFKNVSIYWSKSTSSGTNTFFCVKVLNTAMSYFLLFRSLDS